MSDTNLFIEKGKLKIEIPLTSKGKFRCKNRKSSIEYGYTFGPKSTAFKPESYVEWQIGYDVKVADAGIKSTTLTSYAFIGANGSEKYLYELSEIIWKLCSLKMISKSEISKMYDEIYNYSAFLQENFKIQMIQTGTEKLNNIKMKKSSISLPTFTLDDDVENEMFTEISIQKQQYASGVQPMLYVIIPVEAFDNGSKIVGNTSAEIPFGIYTVSSKEKAKIFLNIMSYFGLCSEKHHHDVMEILKIIKKHAF